MSSFAQKLHVVISNKAVVHTKQLQDRVCYFFFLSLSKRGIQQSASSLITIAYPVMVYVYPS